MRAKYFNKINALKSLDLNAALPPFNINVLRKKNLKQKIIELALSRPLPLLKFLRKVRPNIKFFNWAVVTRAEDVREVLTNDKVFGVPFGPEMEIVLGGKPFILGMDPSSLYRQQKACILSCFAPYAVADKIETILQRQLPNKASSLPANIDPFEHLFRPAALAICEEYFGLVIADKQKFYHSTLAVSSLLFADPSGSVATRKLGVVGAKYLLQTIQQSVQTITSSQAIIAGPNRVCTRNTALQNLVYKGASIEDIYAIMMGMLLGFLPTTILAVGKALEVFLDKEEARIELLLCLAKNVENESKTAPGKEQISQQEQNDRLDAIIAEAMRFNPIQIGPFRICKQDAVIAKGTNRETKIPKGYLVIPSTLSAMFDGDEVDNPDKFDANREHSNSMIYGYGVHACFGNEIARIFARMTFAKMYSLLNIAPVAGKKGKLKKIGIFADSINMKWNKQDHFAQSTQTMSTIAVPLINKQHALQLKNELSDVGHVFQPSATDANNSKGLVELDNSGVVHFMSCCVTDGFICNNDKIEKSHLIVEIAGDRDEKTLLNLVGKVLNTAGLAPTIRKASGYNSNEKLSDIFNNHSINGKESKQQSTHLNFNGAPGHSVQRIINEQKLGDEIRQLVAAQGYSKSGSALEQLNSIRANIAKNTSFEWAHAPIKNQLTNPPLGFKQLLLDYWSRPVGLIIIAAILAVVSIQFHVLGGFNVASNMFNEIEECSYLCKATNVFTVPFYVGTALALGALSIVVTLLIIFGAVIAMLRRKERDDALDNHVPKQKSFDEISMHENLIVNNHLFAVSRIKTGWLRTRVFKFVLLVVKLLAKYKNKPGIISDMDTIHFARWVVIPRTQQLLFLSNYGGSWEAYLEDFITKSSRGITSIWSNTLGFPRTKDLLQRGAKQSENFKNWARRQQQPTPLWYVAYPGITTNDIRRNAKIRAGFGSIDNEKDAQDWLSIFGSIPRPADSLDKANIQTLLFGGMNKKRPNSELVLVEFNTKEHCQLHKPLLKYLVQKTHFGDHLEDELVVQLAFSHKGFLRLGLPVNQSDNQSFPNVFVQDPSHEARARVLGDSGDSHPDQWEWGSKNKKIDVAIMLYAKDKAQLSRALKQLHTQLNTAKATVHFQQCNTIKANENGQATEHFGFADGISQPIIKGTPRSFKTDQIDNVIAPGELICGYPDERGNISASPLVANNSSSAAVFATQHCTNETQNLRNFGFNGSYLVIRQIEQYVDSFNDYCQKAAKAVNKNDGLDHGKVDADWIGEKLIGRKKNGDSLVHGNLSYNIVNNASAASEAKNNTFRYRKEDPQGLACPLGSHIRRANPRDSLGENSDLQMGLTNRHRILRVGRLYERELNDTKNHSKTTKKTEKGLMFMCLNANIERQFEFVQQSWLQNSRFHDLHKESDPLSNNKCPMTNQFSVPTMQGNLSLPPLVAFTKTRGTGYFFLPSKQALEFLLSL